MNVFEGKLDLRVVATTGKQFLLSGLEKPDTQDYDSQEGSLPTDGGRPDPHQPPHAPKGRTSRIKSALSALSSRSSPFLEPPEPDLRPEQMILSSEEAMVDLRKRDREALPRNLNAKKKQVGQVTSGKSHSDQLFHFTGVKLQWHVWDPEM